MKYLLIEKSFLPTSTESTVVRYKRLLLRRGTVVLSFLA